MIVFGWGGGTPRDRGAAVPIECPNCGNRGVWRYITSTKWVRLYFIPIIPYDNRHLLICPVCTNGVELSRHQIEGAKRMVQMTASMASGQIRDTEYMAAVEAFWEGEVPQLAQPSPRALPSTGVGEQNAASLLLLEPHTSQGTLFPLVDQAEGPQRPCPHCREQMGREDRQCPHCGKKSEPWILHEGRWWYRDKAGSDWWLDEERNEWVRYA